MKAKSYNILFRIVSFGADKTNGFKPLVRYKLALGTLILGLTACGGDKNKSVNNIDIKPNDHDFMQITCYYPIAPDTLSADTLKKTKPRYRPPVMTYDTIPTDVNIHEVLCYISISIDAVNPKSELESEDKIYVTPEVMAKPPQGDSLSLWISENIKYPETLNDVDISGRVTVRLIIDTDGRIINTEVLRGLSPELDTEALRVLKMTGVWSPAMQKGKAVKSYYTLPVVFKY